MIWEVFSDCFLITLNFLSRMRQFQMDHSTFWTSFWSWLPVGKITVFCIFLKKVHFQLGLLTPTFIIDCGHPEMGMALVKVALCSWGYPWRSLFTLSTLAAGQQVIHWMMSGSISQCPPYKVPHDCSCLNRLLMIIHRKAEEEIPVWGTVIGIL